MQIGTDISINQFTYRGNKNKTTEKNTGEIKNIEIQNVKTSNNFTSPKVDSTSKMLLGIKEQTDIDDLFNTEKKVLGEKIINKAKAKLNTIISEINSHVKSEFSIFLKKNNLSENQLKKEQIASVKTMFASEYLTNKYVKAEKIKTQKGSDSPLFSESLINNDLDCDTHGRVILAWAQKNNINNVALLTAKLKNSSTKHVMIGITNNEGSINNIIDFVHGPIVANGKLANINFGAQIDFDNAMVLSDNDLKCMDNYNVGAYYQDQGNTSKAIIYGQKAKNHSPALFKFLEN